jgi:hypothetical protein
LLIESSEKEVEEAEEAEKVAKREVSPVEILIVFEQASSVSRIWLSVDGDVASNNRRRLGDLSIEIS